ncbi:MAG: hypothetical protein ACR2PL_14255 [Dehalococcoidia bacterium]
MTEREPLHGDEVDPYWNVEAELGEVTFGQHLSTLRLRAHVGPEAYSRSEGEELVPLTERRGVRTYVMARAYILEPMLTLEARLTRRPDPSYANGQVIDHRWEGMRSRKVGEGQAWYYSTDHLLVLWECFLDERLRRSANPAEDPNQVALWRGFERFLLDRFPETRLLVTTHADPLYETPSYQRFLQDMGYRPISHRAFGKGTTP